MLARARRFGLGVSLSLCCLIPAGRAPAAPGCVDDVPLIVRAERAGVIQLQDASIRDVTGDNRSDTAVRRSPAGSTGGQTTNDRFVATMNADALATDSLRYGFQRVENWAWETNYPRGFYEFDRKQDLQVEAILAVAGNTAVATGGAEDSTVTLSAETYDIRPSWWGGSNALRSLRGRVRFDYTNLQRLRHPGTHRATLTICINVKNHL